MNEQIEVTLEDMNFLENKKQEISNTMLELITRRNKSPSIGSKSGLEQLISVNIQLTTGWEDKNISSLLIMWIEKPGSIRVAECYVSNVWLPQNSVNSFQFNVFGKMSIKDTFGARLYVRIERQDGRKDAWYYEPSLTLNYTDGYSIEKGFGGMIINQFEQNIFVI
jgi:hypothetical protein